MKFSTGSGPAAFVPKQVSRPIGHWYAGVLSAGHARALLSLEEAEEQELLAARIIAEGMSVRATEEAVALALAEGAATKRPPAKRPRPHAPGLNDQA